MSLPDHITSIAHYDEVPLKCLGHRILDVGSSDGYGAAHSRHSYHFFEHEYLGVDIQSFEKIHLPVITGDIFQFDTLCCFDTILLLHVLEHFDLEQWNELFTKIDSLLAPGGWLVVNVPFYKPVYKTSCEAMDHKVGQIDEELLLRYWPFQEFAKVGKSQRRVMFRDAGEGLLRPCVRFMWRILSNHKYSVLRTYRSRPARLVAVYHKEGSP